MSMIKAQTMIIPFEYRGFQGTATYDDGNKVWYGRVLNTGIDFVPYEASSVNDMIDSFKKAVDGYLIFLEELKNKDKDKTDD